MYVFLYPNNLVNCLENSQQVNSTKQQINIKGQILQQDVDAESQVIPVSPIFTAICQPPYLLQGSKQFYKKTALSPISCKDQFELKCCKLTHFFVCLFL